jgi:hypothetical protein
MLPFAAYGGLRKGPSAIRACQLVNISAGQLSWLTAEVLIAHHATSSSLLRDVVNPAQTPRYYRTVSSPVSREGSLQHVAFGFQLFG